jgi:hypothetical protein
MLSRISDFEEMDWYVYPVLGFKKFPSLHKCISCLVPNTFKRLRAH